MNELKFKNSLYAVLYIACFASCCVIFSVIFGIIVTYFFEDARDFQNVFIIGSSILAAIWLIAALSIILNKTVIINSTEIKMCRGKKIKWCIKKEEIQECIYTQMKWYMFIAPISTINAFALQFKLIGIKNISKNFCSLSLKQIKKIQQNFDYPIRVIGTVHEQ